MYHEIPSPEQAAALAAWWSQAFEALDRSKPTRLREGSRRSATPHRAALATLVPPSILDIDDRLPAVLEDPQRHGRGNRLQGR